MPGRPVAVDGLWRVLCPSANSRTIHRLAKYTTSQQQILLTSTRPRGKQLYSEVRCEASCFPIYGTKAAKGAEQDSHSSHQLWQGKFTPGISEERPIWRYHDDNLETFDSFTEDDKSEFIQEIYERLRRNSILGYTDTVYKQVGHLVRYWRERPNKRIYQALLRVNVSHDMGNINRALDLLDEMDEADVSWDVELCQDLLAVLAVHPHYMLRIETLAFLERHWHTLTTTDEHHLIASMLRYNEFEIALDWIDRRLRNGQDVLPWILAKAIHMLCQANEVDEALRLAGLWDTKSNGRVTQFAWFHILDAASRTYNHSVTSRIWRSQVAADCLNPPSGMCMNVLAIAAKYGDPDLATDVFQVLGNRSTVFGLEHYELLLDAYIGAKDLRTALRVLCTMHEVKRGPEDASTRKLHLFLREKPSRILRAREVLAELQEEGVDVPVAAPNCIIRALIDNKDLSTAISVYKVIHEICSSGPNVETFNNLLRGCRSPSRKDLAMFIVAEMRALRVKADQLTYDRLIIICINSRAFEDALKYFQELRMERFQLRESTMAGLIRELARAGDRRAWDVVEDLGSKGKDTGGWKKLIMKFWKGDDRTYLPKQAVQCDKNVANVEYVENVGMAAQLETVSSFSKESDANLDNGANMRIPEDTIKATMAMKDKGDDSVDTGKTSGKRGQGQRSGKTSAEFGVKETKDTKPGAREEADILLIDQQLINAADEATSHP